MGEESWRKKRVDGLDFSTKISNLFPPEKTHRNTHKHD